MKWQCVSVAVNGFDTLRFVCVHAYVFVRLCVRHLVCQSKWINSNLYTQSHQRIHFHIHWLHRSNINSNACHLLWLSLFVQFRKRFTLYINLIVADGCITSIALHCICAPSGDFTNFIIQTVCVCICIESINGNTHTPNKWATLCTQLFGFIVLPYKLRMNLRAQHSQCDPHFYVYFILLFR